MLMTVKADNVICRLGFSSVSLLMFCSSKGKPFVQDQECCFGVTQSVYFKLINDWNDQFSLFCL